MNFYIAIDTYKHAPRNFFSQRKKDIPAEVRPATISIYTDEGEKYVAQFRSAKIHDDKAWDGKVINPADYGYGKSYWDIVKGAAAFITWKSEGAGDDLLLSEIPMEINSYPEEHVNEFLHDLHEAIGAPIDYYESYFPHEMSAIIDIPNALFTNIANFKLADNAVLSPEVKIDLFGLHKRCPQFFKKDLSAERAQKMRERYLLAKQLNLSKV